MMKINRLFSVFIDMGGRNFIAMEGIGSQITPNSLVVVDSLDLNNQNRILDGYTALSIFQGASINDLHTGNRAQIGSLGALVTSIGRNGSRVAEFQEQFVSGIPFSGSALANLVASRNGLQENVTELAISEPSMYPLEYPLTTYVSNDFDGLNSSVNYGSDEVFVDMNSKGDSNRFAAPVRAGIGNLEPSNWISSYRMNVSADNPHDCRNFCNELSLSLATSQPSAINETNISDQCSEISCCRVTRRWLKESRLGSEQTSSSSKELSLSCSSHRNDQFSQIILGSRYLQVIQEILSQIASYSLENLDRMSFSNGGNKMAANMPFSSMYSMGRGMRWMLPDESPNVDNRFEVHVDPALQKRALEAKKTQLLTLLQVVDGRYNQCLDEIHTVVSAFHAATELDPQIHTRFALQTISLLYKSLRERISNQILAMGGHFDSGDPRESEGFLDFQKQWTLQQLKKKDHQLWKPQRGLPERSVSVLRNWMFQNFLHPYPKDAEKHLLAVKSGLTRSQVSNWFINARVRLWKPMIEEMYAEMNKRKGRQNEEGSSNNYHRNHISISNLRFNVN